MQVLVASLGLLALVSVVQAGSQLIIHNRCGYTVWPAILTSAGRPQLSTTGFELRPGETREVHAGAPWNGRIWGRTHCGHHNGRFSCLTGDCASGQEGCNGAGGIPPATLVEINIAANGGQDFYDVSLVDGYNLPMAVATRGGHGDCRSATCSNDVNPACPGELQVRDGGNTIACKSACLAFNQPQYCCGGLQPHQCPPTHYSRIFKEKCPQAYSYAYDDATSTFTCFGGPNYEITFCP